MAVKPHTSRKLMAETREQSALAGATFVLGGVYWLLRERDDRLAGAEREESGSE